MVMRILQSYVASRNSISFQASTNVTIGFLLPLHIQMNWKEHLFNHRRYPLIERSLFAGLSSLSFGPFSIVTVKTWVILFRALLMGVRLHLRIRYYSFDANKKKNPFHWRQSIHYVITWYLEKPMHNEFDSRIWRCVLLKKRICFQWHIIMPSRSFQLANNLSARSNRSNLISFKLKMKLFLLFYSIWTGRLVRWS